ncbi:general amidase [Amylostereum chailletii]|nr:general amidase [Amylostereum chailletii]
MSFTTWQEIVADKKKRQAASIPKDWIITPPSTDVLDVTKIPAECGLLSAKELEITEIADVDSLLKKLASGELSSVEVTKAYYKRAIVAQQVVNCLTEIFVDRALARAAWLDDQLKITGKVVGPLHGLPISLKDQIRIKGLETSMGYVSWLGKYSEKDAVLTEILYACGAVPFVRTNVPQTLMWPETFNAIFGRTLNPYNRKLTSGGSSGGEGALIAMKGSPLGVGSDIGGSVRIPAAFNGLFGFRPSYNRIPYEGAVNSLEGQDSLPSVLGPLSPTLTGIKTFMKAVIGAKPWLKDPLAVRKPWDEAEYQLSEHGGGKKLVFGFLWNDGVTTPHPPIIRAMEMTKKALLAAGHEVADWEPYKHSEMYQIIADIWTAAGDEDYQAVIKATGEPLLLSMEDLDSTTAGMYITTESLSAFQLWQVQRKRQNLRKEYLDRWEATSTSTSTGRPVDAIISPAAPYASAPHGKNSSAGYTMVWNGFDYTACTFPVTKVDPAIDQKKAPHQFLSQSDEKIYALYDPEVFKNAPVALQLVGRTLEEEGVIAMTEIVDAALRAIKAA